MSIAFVKLPGLDRERVLAAVMPVLQAHRVTGAELVWRTDRGGRVLELNVEPEGADAEAAVTIDACTEISRDLSTALDVADVIPGAYQLQVGSPGLDRALHLPEDYDRFQGKLAKVKLNAPLPDGQRAFEARIRGRSTDGKIVLETQLGEVEIDFSQIAGTRLVFEWKSGSGAGARTPNRGKRKAHHEPSSRRSSQSR